MLAVLFKGLPFCLIICETIDGFSTLLAGFGTVLINEGCYGLTFVIVAGLEFGFAVFNFSKDLAITECLLFPFDEGLIQLLNSIYYNLMGVGSFNKLSNKPTEQELYAKYSVVRRDVINNIVYLESKSSRKQYVMKQLTTEDEKSQFKVEQIVKHKLTQKETFILQLQDVLYEDAQDYCNYRFKIYLIFEHPSKDLKLDILERRMKSQSYSEHEILNIFVSLIKGLKFLRQVSQPHEAVCSKNVYLFPNNVVKLSDPWLKTSNLEELPSYHIYASPEKLDVMSNSEVSYDWYLSDLFSLGILGLEAYCLEFMNNLYENKTLNLELLNHRIESIKYPKFKQLVKGLTGPPRLRYQTVSDFCSQFTKKIHVSPSPPKTTTTTTPKNLSPRNLPQPRIQISPRHFSPTYQTNTRFKYHPNLTSTSPQRKFGPKMNIPVLKRHNNIRSMNMIEGESKVVDLDMRETISPKLLKQNHGEGYSPNPENKKDMWLEKTIPRHNSYYNTNLVDLKSGYEYGAHQTGIRRDENGFTISEPYQIQYQTNNNRNHSNRLSASYLPFSQNHKQKQFLIDLGSQVQIRQTRPYYISTQVKMAKPANQRTKTIQQVTQNSTLSHDEQLDIEFEALKLYAENQILKSNSCEVSYNNGSYYEGGLNNGIKQGYGKLYSPNDLVVYEGQWKNDKYHGMGQLRNSSIGALPNMFSFQNMNNIQFGWTLYDGQFSMGKKHGTGKLLLGNADTFQGDFFNERVHGSGIYTFKNGAQIRGNWNNGHFVSE